MKTKKVLMIIVVCLLAGGLLYGTSHADQWYWSFKIKKVGMGMDGGTLTITNGTTEVQKRFDPAKEFQLLAVALTAYSNDSKVHVHYVSASNCFDGIVISNE